MNRRGFLKWVGGVAAIAVVGLPEVEEPVRACFEPLEPGAYQAKLVGIVQKGKWVECTWEVEEGKQVEDRSRRIGQRVSVSYIIDQYGVDNILDAYRVLPDQVWGPVFIRVRR